MSTQPTQLVRDGSAYWLNQPESQEVGVVGGKVANLAHLAADFPVPPGFCVLASPGKYATGHDDQRELLHASYAELARRCGVEQPAVAVRSSAVDEDGLDTSFAGQHDTFLNVAGADAVVDAVDACFDSFTTERVQHYRQDQGLPPAPERSAVLVQQLVPADVSAVLFTANPVNGARDEVVINASWGLGESIVGGTVTPDTYTASKSELNAPRRELARKKRMTVPVTGGTDEVDVPKMMWATPTLTSEQAATMARLGLELEERNGWPVDLELAWSGDTLYLLQCRPVTT